MYTILMRSDKSLVATQKTTLHQRENLVDKIQFLVPEFYEDINLGDFKVILKYITQTNYPHTEVLNKSELKKGMLVYTLPIDTKLSAFCGDINLRLSFIKNDLDNSQQQVLHSKDIVITIQKLDDYYSYKNEDIELIDKFILDVDSKIKELNEISSIYDYKKADNLLIENNMLRLMANGEPIGDPFYFPITEIDSTLTQSGQAADAKTVGDILTPYTNWGGWMYPILMELDLKGANYGYDVYVYTEIIINGEEVKITILYNKFSPNGLKIFYDAAKDYEIFLIKNAEEKYDLVIHSTYYHITIARVINQCKSLSLEIYNKISKSYNSIKDLEYIQAERENCQT